MKETLKASGKCSLSHFNLSNGQSTACNLISAAGSAYLSTASSISKSVEKVDLKDFAVEGLLPLRLGMKLVHCLGQSVEFVIAGADCSASTCST